MGLTWYEIVFCIYCSLTLLLGFLYLLFLGDDSVHFLDATPKEIYENTKLNWFGCYFLWFLEFLCIPHIWITCWLAMFLEWLFTVGRK